MPEPKIGQCAHCGKSLTTDHQCRGCGRHWLDDSLVTRLWIRAAEHAIPGSVDALLFGDAADEIERLQSALKRVETLANMYDRDADRAEDGGHSAPVEDYRSIADTIRQAVKGPTNATH